MSPGFPFPRQSSTPDRLPWGFSRTGLIPSARCESLAIPCSGVGRPTSSSALSSLQQS